MNLSGEKVILRTIEEQDQELLLNLIRDQETIRITGGYPPPASYGHQMDWFGSLSDSTRSVRRIIADKESVQKGLGVIVLASLDLKSTTAEIFIKILKDARGKGYGQDAVNVLVSYGFRELGIHYIRSSILESNLASRRLFEKCGFTLAEDGKGEAGKYGGDRNVWYYGIKADLYEK